MGFLQSLTAYKVGEHVTSLSLTEVLKRQVGNKYEINTSQYSDPTDHMSSVSTFMVKKNHRQGLLVTLYPYNEDSKCAIIYTVPCIPNSLLRFFQKSILASFFPISFLGNPDHSSSLNIDIRMTLIEILKAQPIDSGFLSMPF